MAARDDNLAAVTAAFDRWIDGSAPITDLLAPDLTWEIAGRSLVAGRYTSRQQFVDDVLAPFGARFAAGERFRPTHIRSSLADDDTVLIVWDGRGIANDGIAYENTYAWVMRLADGLVIDATAFFDSIAFDDLWTRVAPATVE